MTFLLEIGLLIAGLFFGIWWFSLVILPLVYGFPRASYWVFKGWAKWRAPWLYLISPLTWTVVLATLGFILEAFAPGFADYLSQSGNFVLGQIMGICFILVRAIFLRSTHRGGPICLDRVS